jgi:hypothetical protein
MLMAVILLTPMVAESLHAQGRGSRIRVLTGSALRTAPGGAVLGTLSRGLDAVVESEQGSSVRVRISGFVSASALSFEPKLGRATVSGSDGAALRTGASEKDPTLAQLRRGTVLFATQKAGSFYGVGKPVWIDKSRLTKFTSAKAVAAPAVTQPKAPPAPATLRAGQPMATAASTPLPPSARPLQAGTATTMLTAPGGNPLVGLKSGTLVTPLTVENGWTRVRLEGWVPSKDLVEANTHAADEVSAADLRAEPEAMKGRVLHWDVEALSYQLADGLRRELNGAPYILALGPGKERAILYISVPDSLVPAARGLTPMSRISVTARVRTGRSEPGGVPILDLLELSKR